MGIQNRDYYRSESGSGGIMDLASGSMCQTLIVITVIAFVLQILITVPHYYVNEMLQGLPESQQESLRALEDSGKLRQLQELAAKQGMVEYQSLLQEWGELDPVKVAQGQIWRLVTYAFLHSRSWIWHILFNMLALWMFGTAIEQILGRREFLAFYLVAAIAAGLCHVLFAAATGIPASAVGASGSVMAVSMLFAIYYPTAPISLFGILTLEARWLITLYVIADTYPVLLALGRSAPMGDGVAHAAHLGGLGFGYLYYRYHLRLTDWFPAKGGLSIGRRLVKWWTRPQLRVYESPRERPVADRQPPVERSPLRTVSPRDLERRVDEILKKIKDEGEASLTDEERNLLRDASQAYKKRNT